MTIDITPEAVEHLCAIHEGYEQHGTATTLRALSAALTASQAETAAAYYVAALVLDNEALALEADVSRFRDGTDPHHYRMNFANAVHRRSNSIRALTFTDSKAALDRMIADARADALFGPWDDKPDALTAAVEAAHPHHTKDYKTYTEALELVSNRHSKGALVGLVNYLLAHNNGLPKGKDHE